MSARALVKTLVPSKGELVGDPDAIKMISPRGQRRRTWAASVDKAVGAPCAAGGGDPYDLIAARPANARRYYAAGSASRNTAAASTTPSAPHPVLIMSRASTCKGLRAEPKFNATYPITVSAGRNAGGCRRKKTTSTSPTPKATASRRCTRSRRLTAEERRLGPRRSHYRNPVAFMQVDRKTPNDSAGR